MPARLRPVAGSAEDYGPTGDTASHLAAEELEKRLLALQPAPSSSGRLSLVVVRQADGVRQTLERAHISPEEGLPGDRWQRRLKDHPEMQITVMRRDVAELIANGQPLTVFGDNFFVELDVSEQNLPVGSRLRVGRALVEVTPKPHTGCHKFKRRFGAPALRLVNQRKELHLRGIYFRVLEEGEIATGDAIEVVSRG